jgi:elongation factor G
VLAALQEVSSRPLVLRQVPIRDGEEIIGCVDLVSERAYRYQPGSPSEIVKMPATVADREAQARQDLLESLADFDDSLLEQLLEEAIPPSDEIYKHLTDNLQHDRIVPVFIGAADRSAGVRRLMKALRHETPEPAATAERLGLSDDGVVATVFKTFHMAHSGKQSIVRVWSGELNDGMALNGTRAAGLSRLNGPEQEKVAAVHAGEVAAVGRLENVHTGDLLGEGGSPGTRMPGWPAPLVPLFAFAIEPENRQDEVKLSGALTRIVEEDPSYTMEHNQDTRDFLLWGQGEIHLRVALERLQNRNKLPVLTRPPQVAYKESIRGSVSQHARHKKQSGGHGQFGDVHIDIKPQPRGAGFAFDETIHGGAVPRQYIPAVEKGVRDYLQRGPLGFPVVDVAVTLTDGQYHSVDSSDQAFQSAARAAMNEGMPHCRPVLLEPIHAVTVCAPLAHASKVHGLIGGRRGQILGFEAREGWPGWEQVSAQIPESELHDFIVELRSLTQGVGTFTRSFDHLQELTGRGADEVVAARRQHLGHTG